MPDVVGVVQPKPRMIPISDLNTKSSYLSQCTASNGPLYENTVCKWVLVMHI